MYTNFPLNICNKNEKRNKNFNHFLFVLKKYNYNDERYLTACMYGKLKKKLCRIFHLLTFDGPKTMNT